MRRPALRRWRCETPLSRTDGTPRSFLLPTPGMLGPCSRARLRLRALRAFPARALPLPNAGSLALARHGRGGGLLDGGCLRELVGHVNAGLALLARRGRGAGLLTVGACGNWWA